MAFYRIQLRRGTAAEWAAQNPVLLEGEVGLETDTLKQKWGDGSTAWNSLSYVVDNSGTSGFSGYSGPSGFSGYSGPSGFSGYSGPSGFSGYSGRSGFSGYSGRADRYMGAWQDDSDYQVGDLVAESFNDGIPQDTLYRCILAHNSTGSTQPAGNPLAGEPSTYWIVYIQATSGFSGYSGRSGFSGYSGRSGFSGYSGVTAQTVRVNIPLDTPDASGNAYPAMSTSNGFSNVRRIVNAFSNSVDGTWEGSIRIPTNYSSGGKVVLSSVANTTSGAVRYRVSTAVVAAGVTEDTAYTDESYVNTAVPGTANQRFDVSFTLTSTPVANSTLNVKVTRQGSNGGDTLAVHSLLWECIFEYTSS